MQVHQEAFWEGDLMKMNEKKEDVFYKMSGAAQKHIWEQLHKYSF